ncbi:MAG: CRISPR-associated helicase/endonuclease Cas3 [Phyllobacteriaceae bacterium]|nr:CRISPR-associated helicase/endonuclease Cas3 [Phyllobacteriaceae bacterium]MBA91113.1 CRISPR-associated helicase/endonuclease Cas3 [Phyllobacteriaceae bacterium]
MKYYAHSGSFDDRSDWQSLAEHLSGVSALAAENGKPLGIERSTALAGSLHDLGKYTEAFQKRLQGGERVDHSTAGARIALDRSTGDDRVIAELIAYAVLGHHAGLPDRFNATAACLERRLDGFSYGPDPVWETEIACDFTNLLPLNFVPTAGPKGAFQLSVLGRMLFSCLVDADFRETEQFYARLNGEERDRNWPALESIVEGLRAKFDSHMAGFPCDGALNALRADILRHVRGRSVDRPGFFTLTVPTGGGKTLASLGFALDHAAAHGKRRIIYAIPFTSIIDQTASIFRSVLGEEVVLEHHSAIEEDIPDGKGAADRGDKLRLAMEDWAAPVVVTTNVQLFESLYAARPSRARKLHNIAGSVIVLDEAQTLPRPLLMPVLRMLEELCNSYGCTVVLCTATQPALGKRDRFDGLELAGRELAPNPAELATKLRRAHIRSVGDMTNDALVAALAGERQGLVIVNSRRHALDLFQAVQRAGLNGLFHLSTRQCAAHRQMLLEQIRDRLKNKQPCRLVATSLVEAGVDIDFPRVWRARAGLDQIVQAAGRCNREGQRSIDDSVVSIFNAPDYRPPNEIAGLIADTARALKAGNDMLSPGSIEAYFREVYWRAGDNLDKRIPIGGDSNSMKRILECFRMTNAEIRTDFAYRSVAEGFRMIESGMESVIIPWDEAAQEAVNKLSVEKIPSGAIARRLQRYVVQVPPRARALLTTKGHVVFRCPELRGDQFAVLRNMDLYNAETGLLWEDAEYLSLENSLI